LPQQQISGSGKLTGVAGSGDGYDGEDAAADGRCVGAERATLVGLIFETAAGLRRALEPLESHCGLAGQNFEVLVRLSRSPSRQLRMSDLAAQTTLTPSGLTRAVDRLVAAGLVARVACPADRRVVYASLSEAGLRFMDEAMPRHDRIVGELFDGLWPEEEEIALTRTIRKLRDRVSPDAARVTLT
jgi:MarR family transcriptional regulator, 2-MHQ and catechol-resistance regulon repressor